MPAEVRAFQTESSLLGVPKRLSRTSRRLSLTGFLLIGITLASAALAIWDRYAYTLAHTTDETRKLSLVLGEQTARSIQAIDLLLQETQAKVRETGIDTPAQFRGNMGVSAVLYFYIYLVKYLPQESVIALVGAHAMLVLALQL